MTDRIGQQLGNYQLLRTPFLVMDYAPKGTLRQLHPKGQLLPLSTVVSYVKQIADALQYAHDEKYIHRDIKPENMLVGRRGEILLSDFGIALVAQSSRYQSTQDMTGTIAYMAPEQIQGKPRPASDQYSLGIVVYEWLTGDRPFHGGFIEIVTQHLAAPVPSMRDKAPTIPPDGEHVVMTALEKDPAKRFGSVQAFAKALEQAAQPQKAQSSVKPPVPQEKPITPPKAPTLQEKPPVTPLSPLVKPAVQAKAVGTVVCTYRGHSQRVNAVTWSPDGKYIASGSSDGTVQVWRTVDSNRTFSYNDHSSHSTSSVSVVRTVAWAPDGKYIAFGCDDRLVHVWNAITGDRLLIYRGHFGRVYALAWAPGSSQIVSTDDQQSAQVWDAFTGNNPVDHGYALYAVTWSPDGSRVASASGDKTVGVWNPYRLQVTISIPIAPILISCILWLGHQLENILPPEMPKE
jgi:eukaryotic-like serine/threonine-protein kinase